MKDLHPDALRVLELANAERTPTDADKARIERKLALGVGAAALASAAAASSASSAAAQGGLTGLAAKPAAAALKLWLAGGAILAAVTASYVLTQPDELEVQRVAPRAERAPEPVPVDVVPQAVVPPAPAIVEVKAPEPVPARVHKPKRDKGGLVAEELALLHAAQAAWRARDAREALALVKAHRTRYPRSQLALERDAILVLSLCELGQKDEASVLARRWLERAPRSPLRSSIESSCIVR
jgi:hypothetical protein